MANDIEAATRAEFEAWWDGPKDGGTMRPFGDGSKAHAWMTWQASRAALAAPATVDAGAWDAIRSAWRDSRGCPQWGWDDFREAINRRLPLPAAPASGAVEEARGMSQDDYVRRVVGWLVDDPSTDPITREKAWKGGSLSGVYDGESAKVRNLVRLAFLRGVIRGAECAWEASQPVVLRATEAEAAQAADRGGKGA